MEYHAPKMKEKEIAMGKKLKCISSKNNKKCKLSRGEIYYADLGEGVGCEQKGLRPVLIIQNDMGNKFSETTIIAPITSQTTKSKIPTHISISKKDSMLAMDSMVLMEQIRIIDKSRIRNRVGKLDEASMKKINVAICISLEIDSAAS